MHIKIIRKAIYMLGKQKKCTLHLIIAGIAVVVSMVALQGCDTQKKENGQTQNQGNAIDAATTQQTFATQLEITTQLENTAQSESANLSESTAQLENMTQPDTLQAEVSQQQTVLQSMQEVSGISEPWYYAKVAVRTYPALENGELMASRSASLPDLRVFKQEYYSASTEDTLAVIHIAERFADLTENTFERKYDETADWCYLSISECWNVIDTWNKMSQLVSYKVADVDYKSQDACTVNIIEFVNDDYDPTTGVYNGVFHHTGEWLGHLHFERRSQGWFLASEDYEPIDMQTQSVVRVTGPVAIN